MVAKGDFPCADQGQSLQKSLPNCSPILSTQSCNPQALSFKIPGPLGFHLHPTPHSSFRFSLLLSLPCGLNWEVLHILSRYSTTKQYLPSPLLQFFVWLSLFSYLCVCVCVCVLLFGLLVCFLRRALSKLLTLALNSLCNTDWP